MNTTTLRAVKPEEHQQLKDICAEFLIQQFAPRKIDATQAYPMIDRYFVEEGRYPYFIYSNDELCGFALVNSHCVIESRTPHHGFGEFYIRPDYRRHGAGTAAATQIFDRHRAYWEIRELKGNDAGAAFWRRVLDQYANGNYTEMELDDERWKGSVQLFSNV